MSKLFFFLSWQCVSVLNNCNVTFHDVTLCFVEFGRSSAQQQTRNGALTGTHSNTEGETQAAIHLSISEGTLNILTEQPARQTRKTCVLGRGKRIFKDSAFDRTFL